MSSEWHRRAGTVIPGGSSTGSKRADALYGDDATDLPTHYISAKGCRVITTSGRELIDCTMALGAVGIGYADIEVNERVMQAIRVGNVSGFAPRLEVEVAERLTRLIPCAERVRFLKTGAEGVAAAARVARAHTGRSVIIGCGYFGWLDWASEADGVPAGVRGDFVKVPFDDQDALDRAVHDAGERLAAVVLEPVIEREPDPEWLRLARSLCDRTGAVLVFDEVKTGFRMHRGGYQYRVGVTPDLAVFGKAIANGFPLSVLVGRARVMQALEHTWVSSTLATESASLAAVAAVLDRYDREDVCAAMARSGAAMRAAVDRAISASGLDDVRTHGVPEMWLVRFPNDHDAARFTRLGIGEGVLFKRGAYNFGSVAHHPREVSLIAAAAEHALARLRESGT